MYNDGEETEIAKLVDVRGGGEAEGEPCQHWYKIMWAPKDGAEQQPTWMSEAGLQKEGQRWRIDEFWETEKQKTNGRTKGSRHELSTETRCPWCCQFGPKKGPGGGFLETDPPYKRKQDLKAHRCGTTRRWKPPSRTGSQLESRIWRAKCKAVQKENAEPVQIEGKDIEWIWSFLYLGHRFEADADCTVQDMKERLGKAAAVFSGMMRVWR